MAEKNIFPPVGSPQELMMALGMLRDVRSGKCVFMLKESSDDLVVQTVANSRNVAIKELLTILREAFARPEGPESYSREELVDFFDTFLLDQSVEAQFMAERIKAEAEKAKKGKDNGTR